MNNVLSKKTRVRFVAKLLTGWKSDKVIDKDKVHIGYFMTQIEIYILDCFSSCTSSRVRFKEGGTMRN